MEKPLIAVIEDEEHLAQGLLFNLAAEGYRTHHESDGNSALAWLLSEHPAGEAPAAILLDVMLPGCDGFSIVRALREAGRYTPVLMLTARGRTEDIVEGFATGADDYLPKPFDLNVLLARLAALLRRLHWPVPAQATPPAPPVEPLPPYTLGDHVIDFEALEIRTPASKDTPTATVHLTLMESDLLRYLIDRPNKIVARKELLEKVWQVHEDTDTRAIDNFIVRLRRYLEPSPSKPVHLIAVRGVGYRFVPEP
jgi:DNA-binding response OmpR family regulator